MKNRFIEGYTNPQFPYQRREAEEMVQQLREEATYENGICRWKSNKRVVPNEIAEFAAFIKLPIDVAASAQTRDKEDDEFLEGYRKQNANRKLTEEEMFEMDAAFGPGVEVVNIITGGKYKTRGGK